jgi:hypothetical protein
VIGLVDGFSDVSGTDAVAYLADERGTLAEGIDIGTVGTLAKGADDCLARNEHLVAVLILADDAIGSNLLTGIFRMSR